MLSSGCILRFASRGKSSNGGQDRQIEPGDPRNSHPARGIDEYTKPGDAPTSFVGFMLEGFACGIQGLDADSISRDEREGIAIAS